MGISSFLCSSGDTLSYFEENFNTKLYSLIMPSLPIGVRGFKDCFSGDKIINSLLFFPFRFEIKRNSFLPLGLDSVAENFLLWEKLSFISSGDIRGEGEE